jgi:hypothetical protein
MLCDKAHLKSGTEATTTSVISGSNYYKAKGDLSHFTHVLTYRYRVVERAYLA